MTEPLVKLLLIDDDLVFRLGLRTWLEQFPDLQVIGEAETEATVLQILAASPATLIILNLDLGRAVSTWTSRDQEAGLQLCQLLKRQYPQIPILLLSASPLPEAIAAARQAGAEGYCAKGTRVTELLTAIRQVATGQSYWPANAPTTIAPSTQLGAALPVSDRPLAVSQRHPLLALWQKQRLSGLQQIDAALAAITAQLRQPGLPVLDRAVLAGRWRELRAARWVVNQLLAPPEPDPETLRDRSSTLSDISRWEESGWEESAWEESDRRIPVSEPSLRISSGSELVASAPITSPELAARPLQSRLFDRTVSKLQSPLQNLSNTPLEIDILREEKKRELLYIILRKLEETLDELRFAQVQPAQLLEKQPAVIRDLWVATTTDFFGKYYTLQLGAMNLEVVKVLLQDTPTVESEILNKTPLSWDLFAYLLFQIPLVVDNVPYAAHTPEAIERAECLLQNLLLQLANAVIQPLLNHFADVEVIKQTFYDRRLISTREIERFRNSLSWKYRLERYVGEPKAIFESQYELLVLDSRGIAKTSIYSPRNQELRELAGLQLAVTLVLETRDAIAPRFRSAIAFLGSGFVYVLTEVLGRGIGLIGRGILQGIGSAWQDTKIGKNGERPKQ
ncbi:DUF3685 domain-containing protein [Trichocoleus sp. FACHB-591]|uniref:DUF3685 domain-containing protein n=1 Tax=Trichocoleus sp. FACHB-591 TaxID=2692872 RepID=UPI001681F784|nr:DUF3685 domain-containing protein [Trichocoleus sp. FACHB-591]MBD2097976.1 DUF3685 domain-containing protein [Trichocoleus sp. FACHB-591]